MRPKELEKHRQASKEVGTFLHSKSRWVHCQGSVCKAAARGQHNHIEKERMMGAWMCCEVRVTNTKEDKVLLPLTIVQKSVLASEVQHGGD